jgi:hypothetical protein
VLKNKKSRAKKRDKTNGITTTHADEKGNGAALALASDVSDGTEEAELLADESSGAQGV